MEGGAVTTHFSSSWYKTKLCGALHWSVLTAWISCLLLSWFSSSVHSVHAVWHHPTNWRPAEASLLCQCHSVWAEDFSYHSTTHYYTPLAASITVHSELPLPSLWAPAITKAAGCQAGQGSWQLWVLWWDFQIFLRVIPLQYFKTDKKIAKNKKE